MCPEKWFYLSIYRQGDHSEGRTTDPADNQSHADLRAQNQEEPPQQTNPSAISEEYKGDKETDLNTAACLDQDNSQLSSSVIIDVPNMQPSMELSTITGRWGVCSEQMGVLVVFQCCFLPFLSGMCTRSLAELSVIFSNSKNSAALMENHVKFLIFIFEINSRWEMGCEVAQSRFISYQYYLAEVVFRRVLRCTESRHRLSQSP